MTATLPADAEQARFAIAQLLGTDLGMPDAVPSFAGNRVFRAMTPDGPVFAKFGAPDAIALERAVLLIARQQEVPVPPLVAADQHESRTGHACLVLREVAGRPLSGDEPAFGQAFAHLRRMHAIACDGFGSLAVTKDGLLRGEDQSWADALRRRTESATLAADAGLVPTALLERVADAVEEVPTSAGAEARLLHGDFHPRHVYADADTITGIIDWGDATAGDPDYDVARVLHAGMLHTGLAASVDVVRRRVLPAGKGAIDPRRLGRLLTYAAVFTLWSMRGEYDAGAPWPPWWPMQTAALERILAGIREV